jgi:RNA polymerase sigma-70 factor (family 1)
MLSNKLTDSDLFEAIILNDEKAFEQLFERHWFAVYSVAYKYVKDEEAALEIAHDIFLNIWTKRHELHIKSFKAYVVTAASYHGIRKRQTQKATPVQYIEDYDHAEGVSYSFNGLSEVNEGEAKIEQIDFELKVEALLNDLPKRCRDIYMMSRKENLTISEIAEKLNISKRTVENQLTSALKHLRTALKYSAIIALMMNY